MTPEEKQAILEQIPEPIEPHISWDYGYNKALRLAREIIANWPEEA